ncbi:MAG TPA: DUF86 domain-containing protein [Candidatus Nanoarchaeia archaeon]|nr:DUF86 domain-containing protein [Candidatus Nanoarchaeia archaeon]
MKLNDKIAVKLNLIKQYLGELEDLLPHTVEEYKESLKVRRACEKTIELAIENVIDVLSVIIANKRIGTPSSEENIIQIAQKNKILSSSLSKKIQQMKGFRNVLVHKYGEVDDTRVYQYLCEELKDFDAFEREIATFLKA